MLNNIWILIANNRRLSEKSLVYASLLIFATSGVALSTGLNTMWNNNQVVQAQQEQIKINKV